VVFGGVRVRLGLSVQEVEPQLRASYDVDAGMPDSHAKRLNIVLKPKTQDSTNTPAQNGTRLPLPLGRLGSVVFDEQGLITRVFKNWGEVRDDEARALAYSLVAAFQNLAAEGNIHARIATRQGPPDNTTLIFDLGAKALLLTIYDSPTGSKTVNLDERSSSE
jgi:hypothetical protein